jgi:hypothetical protein
LTLQSASPEGAALAESLRQASAVFSDDALRLRASRTVASLILALVPTWFPGSEASRSNIDKASSAPASDAPRRKADSQ